MAKPMDYWKIGAVAGALSTLILGFISKIVSMIPGVSVDLQAISITTTGLGGVVPTGLSKYAQQALGVIPVDITLPTIAYSAVGGAAAVVLGAWVIDALNIKLKTKASKLAAIFVAAGLVTGAILSMTITVPTLTAMIVMAVDALILSYILVALDTGLKTKLVP